MSAPVLSTPKPGVESRPGPAPEMEQEPAPSPAEGRLLGIGEVLSSLREEYPGITISKIRFLEAEGLVEPRRTTSGYRKFTPADVHRLRYVLAAQQRHYLPLRVIREHLDALDRGLEPPPLMDVRPQVPEDASGGGGAATVAPARRDIRLSRSELLAQADVDEDLLRELEDHGLVQPATAAPKQTYSLEALETARIVGEMSRYGIQPRHLRSSRSAAAREAGLIEQAVRPLPRSADGEAPSLINVAERLAELSTRMHALLLAAALQESSIYREGG